MARLIFPSSFKCDCGHQSDFSENTVRELEKLSRRSRWAQVLSDSATKEHDIVFRDGRADTMICPDLGECRITDDNAPLPTARRTRSRSLPTQPKFTPTQGRYLAFIDHYTKVHGMAPTEADMLAYFRTSPPSVHQMVVTLERNKLIARTPGQARSIRILIPPESMPDLKTGMVATPADRYPNVAAWMKRDACSIELGYDPKSDTYARAITNRTTIWSGGKPSDALDDLLAALENAIASLPVT
jgi:hypothetical protein